MKHYGSFLLVVILLPVIVLSGCGGGGGSAGRASLATESPIRSVAEASQRSSWTFLVYLDADNDLESAGIHNFNQMETVGSTKNVHVVVQMARQSGTDPNNEHWTGARRYLIIRDSDPNVMSSIRLDDPPLGKVDMGDWHTLKNFVEWGVQQFPADHYCLVIWDHGTGWSFRALTMANQPQFKFVASDDTTGNQINVTDIPSALANVHMDVVAFDACFMQEMEVAYELRNSAHYMVGSSETEPSPGYNYATLLGRMTGSTAPDQLCRILVDGYAQEYPAPHLCISQCAVDLTKMADVAGAASGFAQVLINNASASATALANARSTALDYSTAAAGIDRNNIDLLDYAGRCDSAIGPSADSAYAALRAAWAGAVVDEYSSPDLTNACGISIYVPSPAAYTSQYTRLAIAADTQWGQWLRAQSQ